MRVERRVLPVCAEEERRFAVFERELWRIAVEHLDYGEQHLWAALAGARVAPNGWRRARAMLHFDRTGELKSRFLITAVKRNKNPQLRLRALADIAALRDPDSFDEAIDIIGGWPREERKEATKIMLRALVERRIGRRDQANAWIWRLAEYTRDVHEEYAVQRWPETKRLLGLLVNSAGGAHARNARRLIHAARKQDRRLAAALLAAALAHTPEAEEALRGARTRMARKPPALARELLRNFPKRRGRATRRQAQGRQGAPAAGGGGAPEGRLARAQRARRRSSAATPSRTSSRRRAGPRRCSEMDLAGRELGLAALVSATTSRPFPSMPSARPSPAVPADLACPQGVARAPGVGASRTVRSAAGAPARAAAGRARLERRCGSPAHASPRARPRPRPAPAGRRGRRSSGGSSSRLDRDVQADPEHRPALLRAALDEDAASLRGRLAGAAAQQDDVVGPLDQRVRSPDDVADRDGRDQRQQRRQARAAAATSAASCRRAPTSAGPGGPRPALCSRGRHERPVRGAASASSRARSLVESVLRRCSARPAQGGRGARPADALTPATAAARRRGPAPSSSAAEPRLTARASMSQRVLVEQQPAGGHVGEGPARRLP